MAFPSVTSITVTNFTSETTAHACNMPATVAAGDLLIILLSLGWGGGTRTEPSGWTTKFDTVNGTDVAGCCYIKDAVGNEDGTTVDVVTSDGTAGVAQVFRIAAASWDGDIANVQVGTSATGTGAPDCPAVTPSWGAADNLFIAVGFQDNADDDATAAPTNYSNFQFNDEAHVGSGSSIETSRRELNSTTDNPGAYTGPTFRSYVANTIVIKPVASLKGLIMLLGDDGFM